MRFTKSLYFSLDFYDFNGQFCNQGKYPLVKAVRSALKGGGGNVKPTTKANIPTNPPTIKTTSRVNPTVTKLTTRKTTEEETTKDPNEEREVTDKPNSGIFIYNFRFYEKFTKILLGGKKVVCYHTNWSQYRQGEGKFYPENIDPFLCDIIIYSFAKLEGDRLEPFEWNDLSTSWSKGKYLKF